MLHRHSLVCLLGSAFACCAVAPSAWAQSRHPKPPPAYLQFKEPDQAAGRQILDDLRQHGISGDYYLAFDLELRPKRGAQRTWHGELWGTGNASGAPLSRVVIHTATPGGAEAADDTTGVTRLLVKNGPKPSVYRSDDAAQPALVSGEALFSPIGDTGLTAFELQMPFLYWNDVVYEGLAPLRGRPAHRFIAYPPDGAVPDSANLGGVRLWIDSQFSALVQAELLDLGGKVRRTITVVDIKRLQDQWMVKTIDLRDDLTRDKTRFTITGAALGLHFTSALFDVSALTQHVTAPIDVEHFDGD